MTTELEFKSLAADGYNRIPLIAEAFADLETPLSLYLKLAGGQKHSFLLESVVGGERWARYTSLGTEPRRYCEYVTSLTACAIPPSKSARSVPR